VFYLCVENIIQFLLRNLAICYLCGICSEYYFSMHFYSAALREQKQQQPPPERVPCGGKQFACSNKTKLLRDNSAL
jgi:hypothetical protein